MSDTPTPESVEPSNQYRAPYSRDAAVDGADAAGPWSDAFLPPVGAGEGKDPHGPDVVSPGLHAVPPAPVLPGEVSRDPEAQQAKESEAAQAVLVDNQDVGDFMDADWQEPTGPINASDPASEGLGPDAADDETTTSAERPAGNATKASWVDYAVSQGANRDEAEGLTRDELMAQYGES